LVEAHVGTDKIWPYTANAKGDRYQAESNQ